MDYLDIQHSRTRIHALWNSGLNLKSFTLWFYHFSWFCLPLYLNCYLGSMVPLGSLSYLLKSRKNGIIEVLHPKKSIWDWEENSMDWSTCFPCVRPQVCSPEFHSPLTPLLWGHDIPKYHWILSISLNNKSFILVGQVSIGEVIGSQEHYLSFSPNHSK